MHILEKSSGSQGSLRYDVAVSLGCLDRVLMNAGFMVFTSSHSFCLLLAMVFAGSLCACGRTGTDPEPTPTTVAAPAEKTAPRPKPVTERRPMPEQVKRMVERLEAEVRTLCL